ncbi:prepilin-type N-terminal cleavage/methylation domain-containing protein [Candidatus Saccharibacteria bacterium]|nr:prepilin-type N-terminal cleavage/methylation domain-containing protein [Candidatus Saccharibacteria bacterium]
MSKESKKGFTIIEVVLVLAIAGLIFLMVFIALPALQRGQRNTQREDDLARVLTAVNDFQTNNNGKTPFNIGTPPSNTGGKLATFVIRYIDGECKIKTGKDTGTVGEFNSCGQQFSDPQGEPYSLTYNGSAKDFTDDTSDVSSAISAERTFYAYTYASCGDEGKVKKGTGERDVAIFLKEEGGAIACNDNH